MSRNVTVGGRVYVNSGPSPAPAPTTLPGGDPVPEQTRYDPARDIAAALTRGAAPEGQPQPAAEATTSAQLCEWFARCDRPAAALVAHPALPPVPACRDCIDRMGLADRILTTIGSEGR